MLDNVTTFSSAAVESSLYRKLFSSIAVEFVDATIRESTADNTLQRISANYVLCYDIIMIINLLGLVIPCLIASVFIFVVLDAFIFIWVLGNNCRIIAFLMIFFTILSATRGNLIEKFDKELRYDKKTSIADEYEKLVKQDQ